MRRDTPALHPIKKADNIASHALWKLTLELLRQQQGRQQIDLHMFQKTLWRKRAEPIFFKDGGIVDQEIYRRGSFGKERANVFGIGKVALDDLYRAATCAYFRGQRFCFFNRTMAMNRDIPARFRQVQRNGAADPDGSSGDKSMFGCRVRHLQGAISLLGSAEIYETYCRE